MKIITSNFETKVHGKWILTGEHAVLRGHAAIIFPVNTKSLTLQYTRTENEARAEFTGEYGDELQFLFWSALERAIEILALNHSNILGNFRLENHIPVGCGMGASAALCVAIGRWFVANGQVQQENLLEFARQLENLFHNESSGADIAVAIAGQGIYFSRSGGMHPIKINWHPNWYLSFSGKASTTSRCVKKVKELWITDKNTAESIDQQMAESVNLAVNALQSEKNEGIQLLKTALNKGYECYKAWDLNDDVLNQHAELLIHHGATAVKPTGSGDGGFMLSLWPDDVQIPETLPLIRV